MEAKNFFGKSIFLAVFCLVLFTSFVSANEEISIEIIGDIELIDDATQGINGAPLPADRTYLSEGEQIEFTTLVTMHPDLENPSVGSYVNGELEANCWAREVINEYAQEFECLLAAETPDSMQGEGVVDVRATTQEGNVAIAPVGEWYFNPHIQAFTDEEIVFTDVQPGQTAYSQPFNIYHGVSPEAGVELTNFITGYGFEGDIQLEGISYFAEKGDYSTLEDPRANSEGFVSIEQGFLNDPYPSWGISEIIQSPWVDCGGSYCLSPLIDPANILNNNEWMILIFRYDVPHDFNENYQNEGIIIPWVAAGEGYGPDAGVAIPLRFEFAQIACYENLDCNDGISNTFDRCINPGTVESYCQNLEIRRFDFLRHKVADVWNIDG